MGKTKPAVVSKRARLIIKMEESKPAVAARSLAEGDERTDETGVNLALGST